MPNRWANRILLLVLVGLPLIFALDLRDTFDLPKMTVVYFSVIALAGLWGWSTLDRQEVIYRATPLDGPLLVFLAVGWISTVYSIEPTLSFWGAYRIYVFGFLPMTALAMLYWFSAQILEPDFGEKVRRAAIISGALVGLYALLQYSGLELFDRMPRVQGGRPWSSLGNSLYMGSICMMAVAAGMAEWRGIWIALQLLVITGLVLSLSRSAWLGAAVAVLVVTLHQRRQALSWKKEPIILLVAFGLLFTVFPLARQRASVLFSAREGSNAARLVGWKGALELWKDHPWLGSGPDTFSLAYRPHRSLAYLQATGGGVTQADAHNDILQILSTMGGIGLAAYLWMLAAAIKVLWSSFKSASLDSKGRWKVGLSAGLAALFVQNQFNFSSVSAAAWGAIMLGALAGPLGEPRRLMVPKGLPRGVARGALVALCLSGFWFVGRPLLANYDYQQGLSWAAGNRLEESVRRYQEAIRLHGRIEEYSTEYANRCRDLRRFDDAWRTAEGLVQDHPFNPDVWNNRGVVAMWITQLAGVNRMKEAEAAFRRAVELDPVFVEAWANLAKWEHLAGHLDQERVYWNKVLELDPSHEMAHQVLHR